MEYFSQGERHMSKHTKPTDQQRTQKHGENRPSTGTGQNRPGDTSNLARGSQFQQSQFNQTSKFQTQNISKKQK